jgi:hypothetical protein
MKRWTATATILASAALASTAVWLIQHRFENEEEQVGISHRQVIYRSILRSYSASLNNGMTRAQVEDNLRMRGVQFSDVSAFQQGESAADITKIGFETGPWYCTGYDVYIAFHCTGVLDSQSPADTLRKISIESLPVDCL